MKLLLVTSNRHKISEFDFLLEGKVSLLSLQDVGLSHLKIEETGKSFEENARLKLEAVRPHVPGDLPIFADDSGLEVEGLDRAPGIYSARYAGEGASDLSNNRKLLAALTGMSGAARKARYVCAIAYQRNAELPVHTLSQTCEGEIAEVPRGDGGFGYDPLFVLPELNHTMAEISRAQKSALSHRGKACRALLGVMRRESI